MAFTGFLKADASTIGQLMQLLTTNRGKLPIAIEEEQPITSDDVINLSTVPGASVTDALDFLAPAVDGEPGYLSRAVYVNAASSRVGTTFAGETVEAAPAQWTTAADVPAGNWFDVVTCGGGGGSSGATDSITGATGAGAHGGAGGCWNQKRFSRADIIAALPIVFTIELGGTAGVGNSIAPVAANEGGLGGRALFGNLCTSYGGGGGGRPGATNRQRASGGGSLGPGISGGVNTANSAGGLPGNTNTRGQGTAGAGGPAATGINGSNCSEDGGASGDCNGVTTNTAGGDGGKALRGGAGGASGANNGVSQVGFAGGTGGSSGEPDGTERGGGGTPGAAGGAAVGGNGGPGADGTATHAGDGGGGGGTGTGLSSEGGDGGAGGFPGGGAGGGGASRNFGNGGNGAVGGDPMIMITAHL